MFKFLLKVQLFQGASTDLVNSLVPEDYKNERQDKLFTLQIKTLKVNLQ